MSGGRELDFADARGHVAAGTGADFLPYCVSAEDEFDFVVDGRC